MNVFALNVQGVGRLGDAINHLSDNSAAKASQIVNVLGRIGGAARVFGLSAKQSASLAGAFLALGKPPEVAATSINALLLKLGTADKQGARFQDALAGIGLSAAELKADISQNGEGAIIGFLQRLNTLDSADKMGVLADLFGAEYADDLALLSGGIDNYQKSIGLLANAQGYAGSMQREFQARSETTANHLVLLGNSVSTIAINIGGLLLPAVNALLAPLRVMSNWIGGLAQRFPALTTGAAGLVIGITSLTIALSAAAYAGSFLKAGCLRLASVVTFLTAQKTYLTAATWIAGAAAKGVAVWHKALGAALGLNAWLGARLGRIFSLSATKTLALGAAAKVAAAGQWILNAALSVNPIGLVVGAVAALAGAAWLIYDNWRPVMEWLQDKFAWVGDALGWVGDKWRALFGDDKEAEVTVTERTRRVGGRSRTRAQVAGAALSAGITAAAPVAASIDEVMRAQAAGRPDVTQKVTYEGTQITVHAAPGMSEAQLAELVAREAGRGPAPGQKTRARAHARRHRRGLLMRQTQLILGDFAFTVSTAEYDRLSRSLAWRWPSHARLNRRPALQYQGPEAATITLTGAIHVETSADLGVTEAMQKEADKGQPLALLIGNGRFSASYSGRWVITELAFEDSDLLGDGTPLTIDFTMTLQQWGEDEI